MVSSSGPFVWGNFWIYKKKGFWDLWNTLDILNNPQPHWILYGLEFKWVLIEQQPCTNIFGLPLGWTSSGQNCCSHFLFFSNYSFYSIARAHPLSLSGSFTEPWVFCRCIFVSPILLVPGCGGRDELGAGQTFPPLAGTWGKSAKASWQPVLGCTGALHPTAAGGRAQRTFNTYIFC